MDPLYLPTERMQWKCRSYSLVGISLNGQSKNSQQSNLTLISALRKNKQQVIKEQKYLQLCSRPSLGLVSLGELNKALNYL